MVINTEIKKHSHIKGLVENFRLKHNHQRFVYKVYPHGVVFDYLANLRKKILRHAGGVGKNSVPQKIFFA